MKSFAATTLIALTIFSPFAHAFRKGFNIAANRPDGACKSQADWQNNFNVVKNLGFPNVRLYASSDCNTLANAVPAALNTGVQLLVGVWTEDAAHYDAEKAALRAAMSTYGHAWISAVSVGSEDLYRGNTDANTLAQQIYDVRGMISQPQYGGKGIWVGHVDTYTEWIKASNAPVIQACDFVGMDAYPYYQNAAITNAKSVFFSSLQQTEAAVAKYHPGIQVWVTETGWPVTAPTRGAAVASLANAKSYWDNVSCAIFPNYSTFIFTLRDGSSRPSFGVLDNAFKPLFPLGC